MKPSLSASGAVFGWTDVFGVPYFGGLLVVAAKTLRQSHPYIQRAGSEPPGRSWPGYRLGAQVPARPSTFAAMMKSFSCKPLILWV